MFCQWVLQLAPSEVWQEEGTQEWAAPSELARVFVLGVFRELKEKRHVSLAEV